MDFALVDFGGDFVRESGGFGAWPKRWELIPEGSS